MIGYYRDRDLSDSFSDSSSERDHQNVMHGTWLNVDINCKGAGFEVVKDQVCGESSVDKWQLPETHHHCTFYSSKTIDISNSVPRYCVTGFLCAGRGIKIHQDRKTRQAQRKDHATATMISWSTYVASVTTDGIQQDC